MENPKIYIVMGVSGSGKSTIGRLLANHLNCPFYDGDDYHPPENVAKMAAGIPLTDQDRAPWLDCLNSLIRRQAEAGKTAVLACSALKKSYRDRLRQGNVNTQFICLNGSFDLIWQRMKRREDHYMKPDMLQSQFDTLQPPAPTEAHIISIDKSVEKIIQDILQKIETPS
jgi:gluconokinase